MSNFSPLLLEVLILCGFQVDCLLFILKNTPPNTPRHPKESGVLKSHEKIGIIKHRQSNFFGKILW
jgi:hypothetical protein